MSAFLEVISGREKKFTGFIFILSTNVVACFVSEVSCEIDANGEIKAEKGQPEAGMLLPWWAAFCS